MYVAAWKLFFEYINVNCERRSEAFKLRHLSSHARKHMIVRAQPPMSTNRLK